MVIVQVTVNVSRLPTVMGVNDWNANIWSPDSALNSPASETVTSQSSFAILLALEASPPKIISMVTVSVPALVDTSPVLESSASDLCKRIIIYGVVVLKIKIRKKRILTRFVF